MVAEPTCFCALFVVCLPSRSRDDGTLVMRFKTKPTIPGCPKCGSVAESKGRSPVALIDLQCFGQPTTTIWVKRRCVCLDGDCPMGCWTEVDDEIAPPRSSMTTRAARLGDRTGGGQDGAQCLGTREGAALRLAHGQRRRRRLRPGAHRRGSDAHRVVRALGLDEVLFARLGEVRSHHFSTSIVDVGSGQLLDVVPRRGGSSPPCGWSTDARRGATRCAYRDLRPLGSLSAVFEALPPDTTLVADPFHSSSGRRDAQAE